MPLPHLHPAICRLPHILIYRYTTYAVGNDVAGGWVLDVFDVATDVRLNGGIFEYAVAGGVEAAVLYEAAIHVPEGILAEEAATRYLEVAAVLQGRLSVDQVMFSMRAP